MRIIPAVTMYEQSQDFPDVPLIRSLVPIVRQWSVVNDGLPGELWGSCTRTECSVCSILTSELLLPVAGDLASLGLDGLLAVGAGASSLPGAESAVPFVGYTDAPLPLAAVRLTLLLSCRGVSRTQK